MQKSGWVTEQYLRMCHARVISGLHDFTRHFNFRYFVRSTYNRNLDSLAKARAREMKILK